MGGGYKDKKTSHSIEASICDFDAVNPRGEVKGRTQSHIISSLLLFVLHHFKPCEWHEWQHRDIFISLLTKERCHTEEENLIDDCSNLLSVG